MIGWVRRVVERGRRDEADPWARAGAGGGVFI